MNIIQNFVSGYKVILASFHVTRGRAKYAPVRTPISDEKTSDPVAL